MVQGDEISDEVRSFKVMSCSVIVTSSMIVFDLRVIQWHRGSQSVTNLTTNMLKHRPARQLSRSASGSATVTANLPKQSIALKRSASVPFKTQQAAISQKKIVFRFRKNVQPEKGWGLLSCPPGWGGGGGDSLIRA